MCSNNAIEHTDYFFLVCLHPSHFSIMIFRFHIGHSYSRILRKSVQESYCYSSNIPHVDIIHHRKKKKYLFLLIWKEFYFSEASQILCHISHWLWKVMILCIRQRILWCSQKKPILRSLDKAKPSQSMLESEVFFQNVIIINFYLSKG